MCLSKTAMRSYSAYKGWERRRAREARETASGQLPRKWVGNEECASAFSFYRRLQVF